MTPAPTQRIRLIALVAIIAIALLMPPMARAQPATKAPPKSTAPAASSDPTSPTADDSTRPNLTGRWAQFQVITTIESIPLLGDVESTMAALLYVDFVQQGAQVTGVETMCHLNLQSSSDSIQVHIPKAFTRSLSGNRRQGTVEQTPTGWRLKLDRVWMLSGVALDHPATDSLPDDPEDPRVRDTDRDGLPGATLVSEGIVEGAIYLAQKSWNELTGKFKQHSTRIEGHVRWGSERKILDADSVLLEIEAASRPHPNPNQSIFTMVRVGPNEDCRAIAQKGRQLFQPRKSKSAAPPAESPN